MGKTEIKIIYCGNPKVVNSYFYNVLLICVQRFMRNRNRFDAHSDCFQKYIWFSRVSNTRKTSDINNKLNRNI